MSAEIDLQRTMIFFFRPGTVTFLLHKILVILLFTINKYLKILFFKKFHVYNIYNVIYQTSETKEISMITQIV